LVNPKVDALVVESGMPSHRVSLIIPLPVDVQHADIDLEVSSGGSKLGTLKVSRGSIDWLPAGNSVNYHAMSWERFAAMMEKEGTERQRG
jgi:hypothetical protein